MASLKITNFQSHVDTTVDIVENGINAIIGPTDAGKSAITRAFELLALNRPSGEKYRTHGTKQTTVEWQGVKRVRGNSSENLYEVDGVEYKALRTGVPRQVTEKLKLTDINFRPQHAAYFLIDDSPGAVARAMNELADLGLIDYTTAELKSQQRENSALVGVKVKDYDKKQEEAKSIAWAVDANIDLAVIEAIETTIESITVAVNELSGITRQLQELEDKLNSYPDFDSSKLDDIETKLRDDSLSVISTLIAESEKCLIKLDSYPEFNGERLSEVCMQLSDNSLAKMTKIIDKLDEYDNDLRLCPDPAVDIAKINAVEFAEHNELSLLLQQLEEIETKVWPDINWINEIAEIEMKVESWEELVVRVEELVVLMEKMEKVSVLVNEGVLAEEEAAATFNKLLEECKICPLCGESCGGGHE